MKCRYDVFYNDGLAHPLVESGRFKCDVENNTKLNIHNLDKQISNLNQNIIVLIDKFPT